MRRIYKFESDYTNSEIKSIVEKLPNHITNMLFDFSKKIDYVEVCKKEDGTFDLYDGTDVCIVIVDEWEKKKMIDIIITIFNIHRYKIMDITDDVLFGKHSEKYYNGVEEYVKVIFEKYLNTYLDVDTVLDKINKYGINSLTKRDLHVLDI
jgi:hypothetical protein